MPDVSSDSSLATATSTSSYASSVRPDSSSGIRGVSDTSSRYSAWTDLSASSRSSISTDQKSSKLSLKPDHPSFTHSPDESTTGFSAIALRNPERALELRLADAWNVIGSAKPTELSGEVTQKDDETGATRTFHITIRCVDTPGHTAVEDGFNKPDQPPDSVVASPSSQSLKAVADTSPDTSELSSKEASAQATGLATSRESNFQGLSSFDETSLASLPQAQTDDGRPLGSFVGRYGPATAKMEMQNLLAWNSVIQSMCKLRLIRRTHHRSRFARRRLYTDRPSYKSTPTDDGRRSGQDRSIDERVHREDWSHSSYS